jgi:hypothetical protein
MKIPGQVTIARVAYTIKSEKQKGLAILGLIIAGLMLLGK